MAGLKGKNSMSKIYARKYLRRERIRETRTRAKVEKKKEHHRLNINVDIQIGGNVGRRR